MSLPEQAVKRKILTYFCAILLVLGGLLSYFFLGQLEDPDYTIKQVVVLTPYPGASPEEVEREVTEKVERKIQELGQVEYVKSMSESGLSRVDVIIWPKYTSDKMPQIKDEVRRKVHDVQRKLPPGAGPSIVNDDFGQVYGFVLALVGEEFSYVELEDYAKEIQRELSLVPGASRVELWGIQERAVYVELSQATLASMGISPQTIISTLQRQNLVVDAGGLDHGSRRYRIEATGSFKRPEDIADLTFRASPLDRLESESNPNELIRLGDIADIRLGYREPPRTLMRYNGQKAVGLSIAVVEGGNVVHLGEALEENIRRIAAHLPVGMTIEKVAWQSELVTEAIRSFMVSLAEAVAIVLVVLWIAMGRANAMIVGTALMLTVFATFIVMAIYGIDLQRMSLGALVIALGMMVDNAIVVADGASVRVQRGMDPTRAAIEGAAGPAWPLLGATFIAVSFFFPIYLSPEGAGEFCSTLFLVVAISLLLSWLISMTVTPLQCSRMLTVSQEGDGDPYSGVVFRTYKNFLSYCIRFRWLTIGVAVAALAASGLAFRWVPKRFFPDAARLQFMVDYWAPQGTRIGSVEEDVRHIESYALESERVTSIATFIGAGPPRFYLPVEPERPYSSYAQLLVNVRSLGDLHVMLSAMNSWSSQHVPEAMVRGRNFSVGPGKPFKFEARFLGPSYADPDELRRIAEEAQEILRKSPLAKDVRTDWRQRVPRLAIEYDQARGRWTSVTRSDVGRAAQRGTDGFPVGIFRQSDNLIPILVRNKVETDDSRKDLDDLQVLPFLETEPVPMVQIADTSLGEEDPLIWRRDRKRTITVQAEPDGVTLSQLRHDVVPAFNALELPPLFSMEWGGEYEDSVRSQRSLIPGLIPVLLLVPVILVALFNKRRTPLIIILMIPFAWIGVCGGLLVTQVAFGFMALLGAMSLAGMMIKNAIVLIDEINIELDQGKRPYDAVEAAALSRLRPVAMAAATTILGVVPLLQDVFWVSMAVVIMAGLAVGTLITMILLPVAYCTAYDVRR